MEEYNLMELLGELNNSVIEDEAAALGINVEGDNLRVVDDSQANFFLRRMEELNKEKNGINDVCDKEIEAFVNRVNKFRNSKLATADNTMNYFSLLLEKYAQSELVGSKKKSIKLPFGTLQFKKSVDKYEYEDEKVLAFINKNQMIGLTRTKVELSKKEIKEAITIVEDKVLLNGKEVEGITVTPGETKFSIKL